MKIDETLKQYATDIQWKHYCGVAEHGSIRASAKASGVARSTVQEALDKMRKKAVQHGYAPPDWSRPIPANQVLSGMSTNYGAEPEKNIEQQWVKTKEGPMDPADVIPPPSNAAIEKMSINYTPSGVAQQWVRYSAERVQQEAALRVIADEMGQKLERLPIIEASRGPKASTIMAVLPIGDQHHGMLAWAEETRGDNFDAKISENLLKYSISHLVAIGPECSTGLLIFLGDFFHYDGLVAETPTSRNHLDSEGRYAKMQRVGARMIKHAIVTCAEKYDELYVIFEPGNHDHSTMETVAVWCAMLFEDNPRIHIDTRPGVHHYHKFGKNLIGTHHGDKTKNDLLPMVMAADVPQWWGETKHRYWFTGHIHTQTVKEFPGVSMESFNILAPSDAWAAGQGYRSRRNMKQIVLHQEHGEVWRQIVTPDLLSALYPEVEFK